MVIPYIQNKLVTQYLLLFGAFVILVLSALAMAVYWDAKQAEHNRPIQWAAFVFFTGPLGLFMYISDHDDEVQSHDDMNPYSLPGSPQDSSEDDDN